MTCAEGVKRAFLAAGEAGKAARLAQCTDTVTAAGEYFMRVGLVADIPDQPILRRVKNMMQRHGQLNNPKARAQMPAGMGNGRNGLRTQLIGELLQLVNRKAPDVSGVVDRVQKRG